MELAQYSTLGVVWGLMTYPHHIKSLRNAYQCALGKQTIGSVGYNQLVSADTNSFYDLCPKVSKNLNYRTK